MPELTISPEKVAFIIEKAREFDVKELGSDPGSGSSGAGVLFYARKAEMAAAIVWFLASGRISSGQQRERPCAASIWDQAV